MREQTLLDHTIARLHPDADEAAFRLLYDRIAASELYVLLAAEAEGDQATPQLIETGQGQAVLAFDEAGRLADFAGQVAPSLCLPGKDLCALLAPAGLGIALNYEVSEHPHLLPAATVDWIATMLADTAQETSARPVALRTPTDLPESFLQALDLRLSGFAGAASRAVLSLCAYGDGAERLLLGFVDAAPEQQAALTGSVRDAVALTLSGPDLDIGFFSADDPFTGALSRNGLSFDLPKAPKLTPTAPGMDPDKPPRL